MHKLGKEAYIHETRCFIVFVEISICMVTPSMKSRTPTFTDVTADAISASVYPGIIST